MIDIVVIVDDDDDRQKQTKPGLGLRVSFWVTLVTRLEMQGSLAEDNSRY
jgi:hypothetical protein